MSVQSEIAMSHFNSQPHKEADDYRQPPAKNLRNFNSQPHKEADYYGSGFNISYTISTHSLTRRLTHGTPQPRI